MMMQMFSDHQLNIMLLLCGACGLLAILLFFTRFLPKRRKAILILLQLIAFFLLFYDRMAYIYAGDSSFVGYIMVRVSNFFVFFLTSAVVFGFNRYLIDLFERKGEEIASFRMLKVVDTMAALGMIMAVVAAFTDMYYYFDASNRYHRGSGFLLSYIIPIIGPIMQFMVIRKNRKKVSRLIYISLVLYIFVPIACGILQIFTYGVSIVNMAMVIVSICLYIFTYLDINNTVEHAHEIEIQNMESERDRMQRLFSQTATAFVSAVEKRDDYSKGTAVKVAEYAERIAKICGKDDMYCSQVYYTALLHDVGMIGITDKVLHSEDYSENLELETDKQKAVIGREILSNISEYPYLSEGAYYSHAKYDGTGFPEGTKGEDIPEMARIVAVAATYVRMTNKQRYSDASPDFVAREAFVKGAGEEFDPVFANAMVKIIDSDGRIDVQKDDEIENEFTCKIYREYITRGVLVDRKIRTIRFDFMKNEDMTEEFSEPAIVLFDSYDRRVHRDAKTIEEYHYTEYGEIWFNGHVVSSGARKMEVKDVAEAGNGTEGKKFVNTFEIVAMRFEDHIKLVLTGGGNMKEIIVALPDRSKASYIGLTGENCTIRNIVVETDDKEVGLDDIPRIVSETSYIEHMEADIKNVQIDRQRSASTIGIELEKKLKITFHSMSLPSAMLVWHCPYIVLFSSDDGKVGGPNYREYTLIKLNGENETAEHHAQNKFNLKKKDSFPGWEAWKTYNRNGMECEVYIEKKDNRIILKTENLGISIENITTIEDMPKKVYVALTGDQVALTDIRIH